MDYKIWILERLIGKYEKSKSFIDGECNRKIGIRIQEESMVSERMESAEEKEHFLASLSELKGQGLIDYSWIRYEQGNLIDRIWLNIGAEPIEKCYERLGKSPKRDVIDALKMMILRDAKRIENRDEIYEFLIEQSIFLEEKHKISRFFSEDLTTSEHLLRCLVYLADNKDEIQERVLSTNLYGDSKYFERSVKGKVLSVLRAIKKKAEEIFTDEELLRERGLVKWPEILEFTGSIEVFLKNGETISYGTQTYGAYINSLTVDEIERVDMTRINRVLFIENKANYVWYTAHEKQEDELVLYHGGCYSPIKGRWFRKIYEGGLEKSQMLYFHWSDIDVGGFRIFTRLRQNVIPTLLPYRMDVETLTEYREKGMPLPTASYQKLLRDMGEDPRYAEFREVIGMMCQWNIRLEQENLLI
ncbi:MAG: DUF2220 family protein [Clostridium sp.]